MTPTDEMPMLPPPSGSPREEPDGVRPREVWGVLRRSRRLLLLCTALGIAAGLLVASRMQPVYQSVAKIEVLRVRSGATALEAPAATAAADESRIGTEIEVLRSRALAEAVVDSLALQVGVRGADGAARSDILSAIRLAPGADSARLGFERIGENRFRVRDLRRERTLATVAPGQAVRLGDGSVFVLARGAARYPEFEVRVGGRDAAVDDLLASTEVSRPSRDANIIHVEYRGGDPALARDVPNALAGHFMQSRREMHGTQARSTVGFLRRQLDTIRSQLGVAEDRLQGFREREQVVDLPVEASTQVTRLAQMEAERGALNAERTALSGMLQQARAAEGAGGASPYRRLIAFPSLLRNDVASELVSSLAKVEDERAELLTRRRPNDPDVQALTRRVGELEDQLRGMVVTYEQGLANQVASIDATMGTFQARMDRVPQRELQFARLSRQTRALEETYGLLQTRLKEAEISQAVEDSGVRVVDAAHLPSEPLGRHRPLVLLLAGLFGLGAGVGLAFVREYRDASVRSREDLEVATGLPVLGWIPQLGTAPRRRVLGGVRKLVGPGRAPAVAVAPARAEVHSWEATLPAGLDGSGPAGDAYEWLHRNVLFSRPGVPVRRLLFASPLPGDGKTTTAAGMAATLAQRGQRVLLIDADLRRGEASTLFGEARGPGLAELLAGSAPIQRVLRSVETGEHGALHYIPSGDLPSDPLRLLDSPRMGALLDWLAERYDMVILDSPPLNLFADAAVLGARSDAVVLVARAGVTPFEALVHAAEQCRRARVACVGTVLNGIRSDGADADPAAKWHEYGKAYYARA